MFSDIFNSQNTELLLKIMNELDFQDIINMRLYIKLDNLDEIIYWKAIERNVKLISNNYLLHNKFNFQMEPDFKPIYDYINAEPNIVISGSYCYIPFFEKSLSDFPKSDIDIYILQVTREPIDTSICFFTFLRDIYGGICTPERASPVLNITLPNLNRTLNIIITSLSSPLHILMNHDSSHTRCGLYRGNTIVTYDALFTKKKKSAFMINNYYNKSRIDKITRLCLQTHHKICNMMHYHFIPSDNTTSTKEENTVTNIFELVSYEKNEKVGGKIRKILVNITPICKFDGGYGILGGLFINDDFKRIGLYQDLFEYIDMNKNGDVVQINALTQENPFKMSRNKYEVNFYVVNNMYNYYLEKRILLNPIIIINFTQFLVTKSYLYFELDDMGRNMAQKLHTIETFMKSIFTNYNINLPLSVNNSTLKIKYSNNQYYQYVPIGCSNTDIPKQAMLFLHPEIDDSKKRPTILFSPYILMSTSK